MKILYLLRHGKAEPAAEAGGRGSVDVPVDFECSLSPRGKADAQRMGRALKERGIKPAIVFCSDAPRARRTAEILLPFTGIEANNVCFDHDLYLASPNELANFASGIDDGYESALICGHNPGLEYLADFYLGTRMEKFPTCAFLEIRFNAESWDEVGQGTAGGTTLITPQGIR